jgi:hypothetical protein
MAWEDRTPAEKRAARRAAVEYDRTDDGKSYKVITSGGSVVRVTGINSARVVAGATGRIEEA